MSHRRWCQQYIHNVRQHSGIPTPYPDALGEEGAVTPLPLHPEFGIQAALTTHAARFYNTMLRRNWREILCALKLNPKFSFKAQGPKKYDVPVPGLSTPLPRPPHPRHYRNRTLRRTSSLLLLYRVGRRPLGSDWMKWQFSR